MSTTTDFTETLDKFSRAFGSGDSKAFSACFAPDAQVLLHEQAALVGRDVITESFTALFAMIDTSAFEIEYDVVEVHGDRAYVLARFTETLRPRDGSPAIAVDGRLVCFWRREQDGTWKLSRAVTGRASPDRVAT